MFEKYSNKDSIALLQPAKKGGISVEEAILKRRSIRRYSKKPLNLREISQILWSAYGVTSSRGYRAAPSAGATYPMEIYILVINAEDIEPGLYRYNYENHSINFCKNIESFKPFVSAALGQDFVYEASINIIITAEFSRTTSIYGNRGNRYVWMEAGHIAENISLQAESLGLGTVVIGAFYDDELKKFLNIKEEPLCIMPVGKK